MNKDSGSALQKASFVLLVFIAAALAWLIVRERMRDQEQRRAEAEANQAAPESAAAPTSTPLSTKSSFAPLRPRNDTGVPPPVGSGAPVPPGNRTVEISRPLRAAEANDHWPVTAPVPAAVQPQSAAFTSGRDDSPSAGTLSGRVLLRGAPPPEKIVALDALCGRLHPAPMTTRHFVVSEDGGLANVFVYVKSGASPQRSPQLSLPLLDNVNCEFQPYLLGVRAGQPFQIRNSDPTLHNMHALPKQNREFNVGLPVRGMTLQKTFDRPEVFVQMKCDVHPWMFAYIGVVDHPWFAVTDTNGNFTLPTGLSSLSRSRARRYTIAAVHLKAGEAVQEIELGDKPLPPLSFTLDVPKPLARTETH